MKITIRKPLGYSQIGRKDQQEDAVWPAFGDVTKIEETVSERQSVKILQSSMPQKQKPSFTNKRLLIGLAILLFTAISAFFVGKKFHQHKTDGNIVPIDSVEKTDRKPSNSKPGTIGSLNSTHSLPLQQNSNQGIGAKGKLMGNGE